MPDAGSSIERLLPRFDAQTAQHVLVDADPERTYEALWSANLTGSPLARGLSQAAMLPTRVAARLRHEPPPAPAQRTARLEDMLTEDSPWTLLAEDAGIEVVLGILWRPPAGGEKRDAEEFSDFAEPGFAKVAWSLSVTRYGAGRSLLSTETRTATTDAATRRRFRLIWRFIAPFAGLARRGVLLMVKPKPSRAARA